MPPNIVDNFPIDFLILLPSDSPNKVKIALVKENANEDKI